MSDPYFKSVALLQTFNKEDSGASYLTDYSLNKFVPTATGSPANSTSQKKFDTSSLYLDGSGSFLTVANDPAFNFGSADFTAECWFYATAYAGSGNSVGIFGQRYAVNIDNSWVIKLSGTTNIIVAEISTSGGATTGTITGSGVATGGWNHVALVRSGSNIKLYLNGTSVGTPYAIGAAAVFTNTRAFQIGVLSNGFTTSAFTGYIADVRITRGVARYTANFTPPVSLKSLTFDTLDMYYSYVSLALPCYYTNNPTPVDYSQYKRGVLKYGIGGVSSDQGKFDSRSWKFDGANWGEVIASSNLAFGLGDYTVDFWIWMNYSTPYNVAERILCPKNTSNQAGAFQIAIPGDGTIGGAAFSVSLMGSLGTSYILTTSTAINDGAWHHVALCRCNANNLTYIFLDGVLKQSVLDVTNYTLFGTEGIKIGARGDTAANTFLIAYIDELRITTGIARWVAGFTPPAASIKDSLPELPTYDVKKPKTIFNRGFNWQGVSVKKMVKVLINRKLGFNWQVLTPIKKVVHPTTTKYSFAEWSSLSPNRKVRQSPRFGSTFKNTANWGGTGILSGTIKLGEQEISKKVRLYDSKTGILLQEKWSNTDGTYLFTGLKKEVLYTVTVVDENQIYNDKISANITAF